MSCGNHGSFVVLLLLIFFLNLNDFAAFIKTAVRANNMRQDHRSAIGTSHQVGGFQGIMSAATIAAPLRQFTLWLWGHSLLLYMIPVKRADYIGEVHERQARLFDHFPFRK